MKFILVLMMCIGDLCGNGFISAPFGDEISCIEYSKLYAEAINQRIAAEEGKGQMPASLKKILIRLAWKMDSEK